MRFFKLLKFDFIQGIIKRYRGYLILALTVVCAFFDFSIRIMEIKTGGFYGEGDISFGTFLFYLFGGMEQYIPSPDNPFHFPPLWIFVMLQILFITLYYPFNLLSNSGTYMLVASEKRRIWWLSKCAWNFCSIAICFFIIWLIAFFCTLISGKDIIFSVGAYAKALFPKANWYVDPMETELFLPLIPLPFLTISALSLFQMSLSLCIKPIFSYLFSAAILVASAYYLTPVLPGNFAMAVRSDTIAVEGVNSASGFAVCLIIIVFSILTGCFLFDRYDVLGKDNEK